MPPLAKTCRISRLLPFSTRPFNIVLRSLPILERIEERTKKVTIGTTQKMPPIENTIEPNSIAPAAPPSVNAFSLYATNASRNEKMTHPNTVNCSERGNFCIMSSIRALKSGKVKLSEPACEIASLKDATVAITIPVISKLVIFGIGEELIKRKGYNTTVEIIKTLTNTVNEPRIVLVSFQNRNECLFLAVLPIIEASGSEIVIINIPIIKITGSDFQ